MMLVISSLWIRREAVASYSKTRLPWHLRSSCRRYGLTAAKEDLLREQNAIVPFSSSDMTSGKELTPGASPSPMLINRSLGSSMGDWPRKTRTGERESFEIGPAGYTDAQLLQIAELRQREGRRVLDCGFVDLKICQKTVFFFSEEFFRIFWTLKRRSNVIAMIVLQKEVG